tara:strand:+ start:922 stop:1257 length:336 start_codon:yes stop_codon:yes gene_type:complete
MTAKKVNRSYTKKFKEEAVSLVLDQGYSVIEAATLLSITTKAIYNWKNKSKGNYYLLMKLRVANSSQREQRFTYGARNIKKCKCLLCEGNEVKYDFIKLNKPYFLLIFFVE